MSGIMITGASGFLGNTLCRLACEAGYRVCGTFFSRQPDNCPGVLLECLDLKDESQVGGLIERIRPDVVIHTAYSQSEREVTLDGTRRLAESCASLPAPPYLIFLSTDLVFDGKKSLYCEEDVPAPVMPYGNDKLEAETVVRSLLDHSLVVRTSLLYDLARVPGHLEFAVEAVSRGCSFTLFQDEFRSPMLVGELASSLLDLARIQPDGLLHMAGRDRLDRFSFGTALLSALGFSADLAVAGSFKERGASRPADCSLDSSRAESLLKRSFRGAREVLHI
jgi:dTDP-4-dehydrorhamnose reductase